MHENKNHNFMKKIFSITLIALVSLGLFSCQSSGEDQANKTTFHVNIAPFTLQVSDFESTPQKAVDATEADIKCIALAIFNSNGEKVYNISQSSGEDGFGSYNVDLEFGTYTFVAIGCRTATNPTIESKDKITFNTEHLSDTYSITKSVELTSTSSNTINLELNRLISNLVLTYTNNLPSTVKKLKFIIAKGGTTFNPSTGLTTDTNGECIRDITSSTANSSVQCYMFLTATEVTTDVIIYGLDDSNNIIYTQTLKDVPMKQNKRTMARGPLFADTASGTFTFNTDWEEGYTNYTW